MSTHPRSQFFNEDLTGPELAVGEKAYIDEME